MKNFDWTQFKRQIAIEAPMQLIYNAWAIPEEIERWFLSQTEYKNIKGESVLRNEKTKEGDVYDWQWYLYPIHEKGKITQANGKDHYQFTFADNCIVDIRLEAYEKGTIVSLTQKDIPTDDDSKVNVRLGCHTGWSFYMVNLKSIYEGGLDLRNRDPKLKPMLNT
jgi:uncharacterized protein YndB with AHSA1/START domain